MKEYKSNEKLIDYLEDKGKLLIIKIKQLI